jgi:malate permease and related proteins
MQILTTIIPIFAIIALGAVARRLNFIAQSFLDPANRLVYYLAIPAMIFRAISQSALGSEFNHQVVIITLGCVMTGFILALMAVRCARLPRRSRGTFIQCAFHGNLGYIGLAVVFYYLGDAGLAKGSIIAGLVMIMQNLLAVVALQFYGPGNGPGGLQRFAKKILFNPVIVAALAGIGFAASGLAMPVIFDRSLAILSGMALPLALLLIGASLSFALVRTHAKGALISSALKLIAMPALGWFIFTRLNLAPGAYLPGLILLAAPTATLSYVFALEMQGDADLAAAAISLGTIFSAVTYTLWLHMAG